MTAAAPLGIYIHVPFCAARCGYCDFNTYVPDGPAPQREFVDAAVREIARARAELGPRTVDTVFVGGGTPTLLRAGDLLRLLAAVADSFGLARGAEVTSEANPESVDPGILRALRRGGFTRLSLGMQSAAPHVLRALDRVHTPGRAVAAAHEARDAGFQHVSLDLIYGTPGESDADWDETLDRALSAGPDHVSAYALTVEPGTALAARVRRDPAAAPDDGIQARRFLVADERLTDAGYPWYEVSSWARDAAARCRHNLGYWRSADWWGIGPGAHSHVAGVRWSNVLAPSRYAARLRAGDSPVREREVLTSEQRALEAVLLGLRMREGLDAATLSPDGRAAAHAQAGRGRLTAHGDRLVLTPEGRLFADELARELSA